MLYVAVTRTRNSIYIPEELVPLNFPKSLQIHIIKAVLQEEAFNANDYANHLNLEETPKSYSVEMVRKIHKDAYKPWTPELDIELTTMY